MINEIEGNTVYGNQDPNTPLFLCARELLLQYGIDILLELGASDFPLSGQVSELGIPVVAVDLSYSGLFGGKQKYPDVYAIQADITKLPIDLRLLQQYGKVGVAALEVLEHLQRDEAVSLLQQVRQGLGTNHKAIVSMPVIDIGNVETWSALIRNTIKNRGRSYKSTTGLLDVTHQIYTNTRGHEKIFNEGGYSVARSEVKLWQRGWTGDWDWMRAKGNNGESFSDDFAHQLFSYMVYNILPRLGNKITGAQEEEIRKQIMGWQAIYLLHPMPSSF